MDMFGAKLIELWSTLIGPLCSSRLMFILIPPGLSQTTPLLLFNWVHGSLAGIGALNFLTCGLITLNS
jgi:ABC-type microcin C transport system permease subunit YejE